LAPVLPLLDTAQPPLLSFKGQAMLLLKALHSLIVNHHRVGVGVAPEVQELSARHCPPHGRLRGRG